MQIERYRVGLGENVLCRVIIQREKDLGDRFGHFLGRGNLHGDELIEKNLVVRAVTAFSKRWFVNKMHYAKSGPFVFVRKKIMNGLGKLKENPIRRGGPLARSKELPLDRESRKTRWS